MRRSDLLFARGLRLYERVEICAAGFKTRDNCDQALRTLGMARAGGVLSVAGIGDDLEDVAPPRVTGLAV